MTEKRRIRLIEDDIYSALPDTSVLHHYDKRAARYDLVVSTRLKVAPGLWATHFEQVDGKQVCTKWTSAAKTQTQISSWPKVTMLHGGCMFCETAAFVS